MKFSYLFICIELYFHFLHGYLDNNSEKAKITFLSENNTVIVGEALFVSCSSTGNPVPEIQWYINKMPIIRVPKSTSEASLNSYHNRYLSINFKHKKITSSTLIFKKVIKEDNNNLLTCKSENVMGTDTQTTKLFVYEKKNDILFPTVSLEDKSKTKLKRKNSPAILECIYKSVTKARIYWFKNYEFISETDYEIYPERSMSKLYIKNIIDKDEGIYRCLVSNQYGRQISQPLSIKISDIPPPTNNVTVVKKTATSALICWSLFINFSIIEEFIIYYETKYESDSISIQTNRPFTQSNIFECYSLTKLQPFTTHKIWVISSNSLGNSDAGQFLIFDTLEDLPDSPPKSITASAISNTAVEVRWKPVIRLNGILKKYVLLYTEHPDLPKQHWRHFDTKTESSLISHLTPNKIHHITIQAVNNVGKGPLSQPVAIFTKSGTISECPEFRATLILLNSIKLEWEEPDPSKLQNCQGLQLEISSASFEKKVVNINVNQYSYEIQNIKEDTEILCILRAFNQVGFGMPVKLSIVSAGKAQINKNVIEVLEMTAFTIVLRWRKPNKEAMNMTLHLMEVHGKTQTLARFQKLENISKNTPLNEWNYFNFTKLKPNQKYQIRLTFLHQEGYRVLRESFYSSNLIETKKLYPLSIGYFNLKVEKDENELTKIHAEWEDVPNVENLTQQTLYQLRYRISYPEELSTPLQTVILNSTNYIIDLRNKPMYGVTYEVVLSRYGNYNTKLEAKKFIKLSEKIPGGPPLNIRILNMSASSVIITYESPLIKYTNGKILFFEVEMKSVSFDGFYKIINTTNTKFSFVNLKAMPYKFRVRAYNSAGNSPWSNYLEFTIHDVEINPPQDVKAYRISDSRIKVEWKMGLDQNLKQYVFSKNIFGFVLYYGTRDTLNVTTSWSQIKLYENIYNYEIANMQGSDFYIVRMSSIDQYKRVGKWSLPAIPENVDLSMYNVKTFKNLQCHNTTSDVIEVRGDYPLDTTYLLSVLVLYSGRTIFWSPTNPEKVDYVAEKELSFDYSIKESKVRFFLKELQANTKYTIRIVPIYSTLSKFDSNITISTNIYCETKVDAPRQIISPQIVDTSTVHLTFRIFRTDERYGKIDYYHLLVIPYLSKSKSPLAEYDKLPNEFSLIELSTNTNEKNKIKPFIAFSKTSNHLFNLHHYYDFQLSFKNINSENDISLHDGTFYRSALRACVQVEEGRYLCNTSQWSKIFQLFVIPTMKPGSQQVKKSDSSNSVYSNKFNEQAVITVSITLSGIMLAVLGIIIGCIVHKRKASNKKWDNTIRTNGPELLQDAQLTPLVDVNSPKFDKKMYPLRTDQNFGFENNNDMLNYKGFKNNNMCKNHFDSPIQVKSKMFNNSQDITPDIVNICDGFNYFNNDVLQISPNNTPKYVIPLNKLSDYLEDLKRYDSLNLMQEFEELNKETFNKYPSVNSNLPQNKMKNRYANIVSYDHSAVILQNHIDRENGTYINANYIDGYGKQNEYIATQGPLPETINDFWQMIWEQRTSIIVMLVKVEESESKIWEIYWPKKGTRIYLDIEVTLLSTVYRAYYVVRKFQVKQHGFATKRQIYHLQFTSWPDQGIPNLAIPFISFLKIYQSFDKLDSGPTVIHCSAGVGRTGVFIVADCQTQRIKQEKTVNVYDQVKDLRKQRNYMVQTEAQYGFIYDILLEWSQEGIPPINPDALLCHIKTKSQIIEGHTLTGFETEFQKLNLQSTNINANMSRIHGNATVNKQKNNSPHLLPFDWNRVALSSISGVEGSDYINASFIDSYLETKAYIVTQDPIASTVEDFWRLVWDKNCSIIIVLGKLDEFMKEMSLPYWPVQKSIRYQFFVVDPMVEYNMSNYIMREFKVTDARDGEFKTIRQFHYFKWLSNVCPYDASSFMEFIHQVQMTRDNFGHGNPLLVHCSYGTGKSGIFIAVNNILEKMRHENVIDVYNTIKLLQQQRVGLVQTVDQYKFTYLSTLSHLIDINPDLKAQFCGFKDYINLANTN